MNFKKIADTNFKLAKDMGKTKLAYSFIENKDFFFSLALTP